MASIGRPSTSRWSSSSRERIPASPGRWFPRDRADSSPTCRSRSGTAARSWWRGRACGSTRSTSSSSPREPPFARSPSSRGRRPSPSLQSRADLGAARRLRKDRARRCRCGAATTLKGLPNSAHQYALRAGPATIRSLEIVPAAGTEDAWRAARLRIVWDHDEAEDAGRGPASGPRVRLGRGSGSLSVAPGGPESGDLVQPLSHALSSPGHRADRHRQTAQGDDRGSHHARGRRRRRLLSRGLSRSSADPPQGRLRLAQGSRPRAFRRRAA